MSKMTPKSDKFITEITHEIEEHSCRLSDIKVYYDGDKWSKRDYVANITISRDWDSFDTKYLKMCMRYAGATNIIGCVRHAIARDYLDLAFDIKKSKMKELGINISKAV